MTWVKVTLLTFRFSPTEMPWAVAKEKGYFAAQALDVDVVDGNSSSTTVGLVGQDPTKIGLIDGSVLIRAVAQDLPLKAVFGLYQTSPASIFVLKSSGITTPKALEGKRLAGTAGGASEVLFPSWMRKNGGDPDKVEVVSLDAAARNQAFISGIVHGAFNFITEAATYKAAGLDAVALRYTDYGFNIPSVSVVVNSSMIKDYPDLVRRFVIAYQQALAEINRDSNASIDALIKHGPATLNRAVLVGQWAEAQNLLRTPRTKDKAVGYMAPEDWQDGVNILAGLGDLKRTPKVDELMTNQFIPGS